MCVRAPVAGSDYAREPTLVRAMGGLVAVGQPRGGQDRPLRPDTAGMWHLRRSAWSEDQRLARRAAWAQKSRFMGLGARWARESVN